MFSGGEYGAAFTATIAAAAYAIVAREEKLATQKKPVPIFRPFVFNFDGLHNPVH
jgi:hypothetical protein